ncbi:HDOD domain-containing protein [Chitinibacter sp. SCUT-21]|uniref:EAL and HDOD domain-containing protein n=1 Tax=Chitinibacter sp. SCUT-21 TaxID=2970891 RepID=UPI0035A5F6DF
MLRWLINQFLPTADDAPSVSTRSETPQTAEIVPVADKVSGLLRRRAIYNRQWQIIAYTFSLRDLAYMSHSPEQAVSHDDILLSEIERILANQTLNTAIWIELGWKSLPLLLKHHFHKELTIIAHGDIDDTAEDVDTMLQALQSQYVIGATAKRWHQTHPGIGKQITLIALNVQSPDFAVLSQQVNTCRQIAAQAKLWVNDVDSREAAEACFQLGADFVSGRVFNWPEAQQLAFPDSFLHLNRVMQMARQNADAKLIADELKTDPALSVRLLRYVNSAALGLAHSISNLDQAIVVVGNQRLYRWLSLLLFSSKGDSTLDQTLLETALTRARLMETAAATHLSAAECELLFLTGLFSLLDFLLRVPRAVLLKELNPPQIVIDTLCGQSTAFSPFLQLAEQSEVNWPSTTLLEQCQLTSSEFNRLQIEATLWTLSALAS